MKSKLVILFALFLAGITHAQAPFITTWEVTTGDLDITIPANLTNGMTFDYTIDFGDGTVVTNVDAWITHTYSQAGTYTVEISGDFPAINCWALGVGEPDKLKSIEQWGDIQWETMATAFAFCRNLVINATDAPDLSLVENLGGMFWEAESMNQSIDSWDVSNVRSMSTMFWGASSFNQPLNSWNVSNVLTMELMFARDNVSANAIDMAFNQPLNNWNVENVTNMRQMFYGASSFNGDISSWNVSSVINMERMFADATVFNQPLNSWNVINVTNMGRMFDSASAFNQSLNLWNVSNVTNMEYMFSYTGAFNGDISSWDVSGITSMEGMFRNTTAFNQPIGGWNVINVTSMESTFEEAISFNQPLNDWNVSNVTIMSTMFRNASSFNQSLNSWNVTNVDFVTRMFKGASAFNGLIEDWNIASTTSLVGFLENASAYNQPLNNWNVAHITAMSSMFRGASSFNQPLSSWDVTNIIHAGFMFRGATNFNQSLSTWNLVNVTSLGTFLDYTGMDIENYDSFLSQLVTLNRNNLSLGAEGLQYCNEGNRNILINDFGWNFIGDSLAEDCNTIIGTVLYDVDGNGCTVDEIINTNLYVNVSNTDLNYSSLITDGTYAVPVSGETFTVSLVNVPSYFSVNPQTTMVTFSNTGEVAQVDFCLTANQAIDDLNITILPLEQARPGFEANYQLVIENIGTNVASNITATFTFDATMQTFTTANPAPFNTTANTLEFNIPDLQPLQSSSVAITMQTFTPPTVNSDDILNFTATVSPNTTDNTADDNTFELSQVVVNSFDPNDKQVLQGAFITINEVDEYLNYIIRFQNTGTASAINVSVFDILHPDLDWNTLKVTSSSHNYTATIEDGNVAGFTFENINLPAQITNDADSNGFIAYKIKPKPSVQIGDIISGNAYIFFDFNAPIITNTVSTEIIAENLSVSEFENASFILYPSIATTEIIVKSTVPLQTISIYDMNGRLLKKIQENGNLQTIVNVSNLSKGMYFIEIQANNRKQQGKFIKK